MAQPLNYATQYQQALANAFPYKLHFGELWGQDAGGRYKWVDEKTIKIPRLSTTGRVNADRDTIAQAARNYENSWETKTLENMRKWSTLVHPKDIDQTKMVASIANITKTFNETQKFPEMDCYLISKLYSAWTTSVTDEDYTGHTANTDAMTDGDAVLAMFDKFMLDMDNANVPADGRILYVTNEVKTLLKDAASIAKRWDVQVSSNAIHRNVEYLDNVKVNGVPKQLMKTVYDFTQGWKAGTSAQQIDMFMVHPVSIITPISYTFAKLDEPVALSEGKYVYYEESFEDCFILDKQADALQFHVTAS